MSEAPERIYLDGDVEAGDGIFPRCFENPKYVSEPPVEYVRADRIEELEANLRKSALQELSALGQTTEAYQAQLAAEARIVDTEAKLERAVAVAEKSIGWLRLYGADVHKESTTLAELKGQDDE